MRFSRRQLFLGAAAAAALPGQTAPVSSPAEPLPATGRRFTGEALREIAFPLGGIGTGTVSLGGFGNFRDWEIFNRPNKGSIIPFTFVALRLAGGGLRQPVIRVVERQTLPPYPGGSGVPRETGLGLPRFKEAVFTGSYPFAHIGFQDAKVPVEVSLEAFNPMIPLATDDSGLPVAVLSYIVRSRSSLRIDAALAFSLMNPVGYDSVAKLGDRSAEFFGQNVNEFRKEEGASGLLLSSKKYAADSPRYGSLAVVTDAAEVSYRTRWEHGEWWDEFQKWWDEFLLRGRFPGGAPESSEDKKTDYSSLAAHFSLEPGEMKRVTFVLGWHFPNNENYFSGEEHRREGLKNHYGTRWESAWQPAVYALRNAESLRQRSARYRDNLYASTLPPEVIDAVSSQASILRTNTVMVMAGKLTLAFEGCNDNEGCCPMNCTHVYNYEQAMAHLFPDLERSMRETDFLTNIRPDGGMSFRTPVPLKMGGNDFQPAADGQMGCVMKVYREWLLGAGDEWLRKLWPNVKRVLEYAWVRWDKDRDGVMEDQQHNTYDIEFYGPNSMMGTLYLGALQAAARMARHLGDRSAAESYEELFKKGGERLDQLLWNGEYYVQKVDESRPEAKKYQYGEGCLSDQLLGQWFSEVAGLDKSLPHDHIRTALHSIFQYNFHDNFSEFANAQRIYALNDEQGLLLCSWPRGKRPVLPFVYSDEVWTGIEYQVAAHLIYEGMVDEGISIVRGVRDRYNGVRRNPWNEVECGHHYARAMSSWSLLTSLSGFRFRAPEGELRFQPRVRNSDFRCLFSAGVAWGNFRQASSSPQEAKVELEILGGALELKTLVLPATGASKVSTTVPASLQVVEGMLNVRFEPPARLKEGEKLELSLS